MGEGPDNSFDSQTLGDSSVLEDVVTVIEIDKLVLKRLAEYDPNNCRKKKTDTRDHPTVVRTVARRSKIGREDFVAMNRGLSP
jgi:hypothetical protein